MTATASRRPKGPSVSSQTPAPYGLRFEHHREALGIGSCAPRLSWLKSPEGPAQAAYEVEIAGAHDGAVESWRIESSESVLVPWPGAPLRSRERRQVRVRVFHESGIASPWSEPAVVEAGLLTPGDWTSRMISPAVDQRGPAALIRRTFEIPQDISSARLYISAHGIYEAELNGQRMSSDVLVPGWTSYDTRLQYQTYEVTGLLRPGANAIGIAVADGWYRGRLTWDTSIRDVYGDGLGALAQLEVRLADGTRTVVGTDETWRAGTGAVLAADLYDGEHADARLHPEGWSLPTFDDAGWGAVEIIERDPATLIAPEGPPVRVTEEVPVAEVITTPSGATVLDFGQNLVGKLRISVRGDSGTTIRLRHAEVLENGELGTRPLRSAKATDTYILRGDPEGETWTPAFTFHGFRYAEIDGWPGQFDSSSVTALVMHSDMERTGWFECSDPLLNRLHENVVWGMRGNFVDVPTDCPQRDERLGWTGDLQVFAPTASYLYDCAGFASKWLGDLAAEQSETGIVPIYIPHVEIPGPFSAKEPLPQAGWGDAVVVVPWVLYQRFGDTGILQRQYESMRKWVDGLTALLGERSLWNKPPFQLGDWLDPSAPPDNAAQAATDSHLVSTAYRIRVADLLAEIATILGHDEDAQRYADLAATVREVWNDEFATPVGRLSSDSQTSYALALEFSLLPTAAQRARAGGRLVEVVRKQRHRIGTGFLGTPLICDALVSAGAVDDAYQLLLQTECPSWLYPVTQGATTVWERWDSMLPDGSINPGEMTSFNHYAFGAVADWMHRVVAGLAPASPGYRELSIAPIPGGGLTSARATHLTPYGRAEVAWRRDGEEFTLNVTVPPGTTATVRLPRADDTHGDPVHVGSGTHQFDATYRDPAVDPEWRPAWPPA